MTEQCAYIRVFFKVSIEYFKQVSLCVVGLPFAVFGFCSICLIDEIKEGRGIDVRSYDRRVFRKEPHDVK